MALLSINFLLVTILQAQEIVEKFISQITNLRWTRRNFGSVILIFGSFFSSCRLVEYTYVLGLELNGKGSFLLSLQKCNVTSGSKASKKGVDFEKNGFYPIPARFKIIHLVFKESYSNSIAKTSFNDFNHAYVRRTRCFKGTVKLISSRMGRNAATFDAIMRNNHSEVVQILIMVSGVLRSEDEA